MRSKGVQHRRGLSLMESLMLVVILAIISTGTGQVLMAVTKIPKQTDATLRDETSIVSKMEQMRSVSFDNLPIGTAVSPYSDNGVYVDVAYADPHGGNSPSTSWKQIPVRLAAGRQIHAMVCKP